jgi:LacI family transcriptional regulator
MEDVARLAKVSTSTVSHVLNGTRQVSAQTVAAVEQAVQALGYVPNTLARSLARSRTNTIGVAISALSNHYFSETVHAIETECARHGIMMLFVDTHDDPEQELRVVKALHHRRVDGILLAPSMDPLQLALAYLQNNGVPTVLVDRLAAKGFSQVGVENRESTRSLITHLVGHGHQRIGMVAGAAGLSTTEERIDGYRAALADAGLPWDDALLANGESRSESARIATHRLLGLKHPPTAIMAGNNLMTIGAMHALREADLRVPEQMALVGFDDFDWADFFLPRLSVIAQPVQQLGVQAVTLLLDGINNPEGPRQTMRLAPSLRIRNSCGCP